MEVKETNWSTTVTFGGHESERGVKTPKRSVAWLVADYYYTVESFQETTVV